MTKFYLLSHYPKLTKRLKCCYKSSSKVNKENFEKLQARLKSEFDIKRMIKTLSKLRANQAIIMSNLKLKPRDPSIFANMLRQSAKNARRLSALFKLG